MATIDRGPRAERDLADIAWYIAQDSPAAADRFLDLVEEKLNVLSQHPELGQLRPDLADSLRSIVIGRYVIYYRPIESGVELVRVIHAARDLDAYQF